MANKKKVGTVRQTSIFDKKKKIRPNPFKGADDIYTTKNKIAVVTMKTERRDNVNVLTTKTKYYTKNSRNLAMLREVDPRVRRGRNGTSYDRV